MKNYTKRWFAKKYSERQKFIIDKINQQNAYTDFLEELDVITRLELREI